MNPQLLSLLDNCSARFDRSQTGRTVLRSAGCLAARVITKRPIDFRRVGKCWFRLDGGSAIPLGSRLRLSRSWMMNWELRGEEISRLRRAWWFRHYRPSMGDLVLDVGAGRGEDTFVLSAAVGPSGTVLAIEAHPETFTILEDFVRLNELPNVHLEHCAVSDRSGTCLISEEAEEFWQCASLKFAGGAGRPVPAKRIDDLPQLVGAKHIAFLKMNIEGAEVGALQGAREILAKTDNICVCCHDFLGEQTRTKVAVEELLKCSGFNLLWSPPDSPVYERDFVYGTR